MAIKNTKLGGTDWSTPTARVKPTDLNDTFDAAADYVDSLGNEVMEHEIEIIELQAAAAVTPFDHDTLISDTFSDATGYEDSVNTGNTTATFSVDKYSLYTDSTIQANNSTAGGQTSKKGLKFIPAVDCKIDGFTLHTANTSRWYLYSGSVGGTLLASGFNSTTSVIFDTPVELTASTTYYLVTDNNGASYTSTYHSSAPSFPYYSSTINATACWDGNSDTIGRNYHIYKISFTSTPFTEFIEIDLPTISGTVVATELLINGKSPSGTTYDLIDTDTTSDTGLAINTKNNLVNPDGTKITGGTLKIYPNREAKTYCLKLWKS